MHNQSHTVTFDAAELLSQAQEKTQLRDFGEPPLREPLQVLCETYDRHVLDPQGRARCRARLLDCLQTRLRIEEAFKQHPEFAQQEIEAPVFVTGLPRSGTSALLNMLADAPGNRGLLRWEIQFPDPLPGSKPGDVDPRHKPFAEALARQSSAMDAIHFAGADTPEECVLLHAYACSGVQMGFEIMLEPYRSWLLAQDLEPLYDFQKRVMQLLQWRRPAGQRWLLKSPAHMLAIDSIKKVFPDARFIWCHRNPQKVVPSINSMNRVVMQMLAGDCSHLDNGEIGRSVMDWYAKTLEMGLAARAKLPGSLFVDCSHQEFVEQPVALAQRIYTHFDLPFSDETRAALQAHVDANPKGKHGKHTYNLDDYGLTGQMIDDRFAFYYDDGRWPISA